MNSKMATNTYLSTIESKKQNNQTEQKQNHRYREHFDGCQMGGEYAGMGEEVSGLRSSDSYRIAMGI